MSDKVKYKCENNTLKELKTLLNSLIEREGYINSEVEIINLSTNGGSYMGTLYEVNIKGTTNEGDKITNIFVKNKILTEDMIYSVDDVYNKELFAYKELAKIFNTLQEEANVPIEERYKMAYVFKESSEDSIILENLMKKGFKTYFRTDIIGIKFAKMAVKYLAKFHGLSFVLQCKKPEYFKINIEPLKAPYKYDEFWSNFCASMTEVSLTFLDKEKRDKYKNIITSKVLNYPQYMSGEHCKVKTLCHGDYRHNNIMMRESNGSVTEIIPVDYQILHYGNPVLDLFYLIFWGTDTEFRRNYMTELKEIYYESLRSFLTYFVLDVELIYPRKEFEKEYKEKMDFGIMISSLYLPFLFPREDEMPDLTQAEDIIGLSSSRIDKKFEERYRGIIEDFIYWGYLF